MRCLNKAFLHSLKPPLVIEDEPIEISITIAIAFSAIISPFVLLFIVVTTHSSWNEVVLGMLMILLIGGWLVAIVTMNRMARPRLLYWQKEKKPILINSIATGICAAVLIGFPFNFIVACMGEPSAAELSMCIFCGIVACGILGAIYAVCLAIPYKIAYWFLKRRA